MSAWLFSVRRGTASVHLDSAVARLALVGAEQHEAHPVPEPATLTRFGVATSGWADEALVVATCGYPEQISRSPNGPATSSPIDAAFIAAAWRAEGVAALDRLSGSFSVLVWEVATGTLHLQVDQIGVMPLFVRITDDAILAATEVTPLVAVAPAVAPDPDALPDVFASRFLSTTHTVWHGIRQVLPGRRCTVNASGVVSEAKAPRFTFGTPNPSLRAAPTTDALQRALIDNLERLRDQGVSDVVVPLSGGIDSSVVAALAAKVFPRCTAVTFRIDDFDNPELARTQQVADRLGLPLHIVGVSSADVARLYPWVIARIQEPPRHYNNVVVARMLEASREIASVVLSGDNATVYGAGTIGRVRRQLARQHQIAWMPRPLQRAAAVVLQASGLPQLRRAADLIRESVPQLIQRSQTLKLSADAAVALPASARSGRPSAAYVARSWDDRLSVENAALLWTHRNIESPIFRRNTRLAQPLGVRYHYPLQDVAALDLAAELPPDLKWDPETREGKPLLRTLCASLVGADVSLWPKIGFPTPELAWMEGPLADRLDASLSEYAPVAALVNVGALRSLPRAANQQTLWTVMTLNDVLTQGFALMEG